MDKAGTDALYIWSRIIYCIVVWSGADPGGGGSRGPRTPPGPQRGGPGPLFQNEENSIFYLFYLLSCYNASEQLSGHQISNPQLHMESFIQVLIHLWHVEILIVCVLDKITVLFSISISSKIYLQNSDWSTDWSWLETKTYIFIVWIT